MTAEFVILHDYFEINIIKKRRSCRRMELLVNQQKQQFISVLNPDSVNPEKPYIPHNYKNRMELNKLRRKKYFTNTII